MIGRMGLGLGFGLGAPSVVSGAAAIPDALEDMLIALESAGKLVAAWYLPLNEPERHLTLNGAAVEGWAAAYGSQKLTLTEVTNTPAWDATLFGNKGGVVFDGVADILSSSAAGLASWPNNAADLSMVAAVRCDNTASLRYAFGYGSGPSTGRLVGTTLTPAPVGRAGLITIAGATDPTGSHTIGATFDIGGVSAVYLDGVSDGTAATASPGLTATTARMGANPSATPGNFWSGAIVAAAVLNSTAALQDFLDLEALMRARLT